MLYNSVAPGKPRAQDSAPVSIFEHLKFIDPIDPNKVTAKPPGARNVLDYYTPIKMKKPDINQSCYWDKRTFKIKSDIEVSMKRSAEKKRYELYIQNQEYNQEQIAESANRRSNLSGELYVL